MKRGILILILIILALFSISYVCASDVSDAPTANADTTTIELSQSNEITTPDENQIINQPNDEKVAIENDLDILSNDTGTYSQLTEEIGSGGDKNLSFKYYTYDYGSTIIINDAGVIDGRGAIIDMAGSNIRAFKVNVSGVTFKNLTIKNVNYDGDGGAIYFTSSGTVENCNFTNNTAEEGSAIYFNKESTGTVENCNFANNSGTKGGVIHFRYDSIGTIENCNFTNNTARDGGAIYFEDDSTGTIENCNFTNNTARDGGAIYFEDDTIGTVENCNFENNHATSGGGAVYFNIGGNVTNCNFTNNTASEEGGAIYSYTKNTVTIENCNFSNNVAGYGGALHFDFWTPGIIENCDFENNRATSGNGGAINFEDYGEVINCSFTNNLAPGEDRKGGAIYFEENGKLTNCNFANNNATDGGAVYFGDTSNSEITDCNFTNNHATGEDSEGGAVYFTKKCSVTNCNFVSNTASIYGGAVYFYRDCSVTNCNFTNNNAKYGGAIYFGVYCSAATVDNCIFTDNSAVMGAAIYLFRDSKSLTVSDSTLLNNKVIGYYDYDTPLQINKNDDKIEIYLLGNNNLLNAIYSSSDVNFINVTYWGANGITNTGSSLITSGRSNREAGQNISVVMVVNDIVVLNTIKVTDESGTIVLDAVAGNCTVTARHDDDSYYSETESEKTFNTTGNKATLSLTDSRFTVTATVTPNIATGNVTFIVENESGIVMTAECALIDGVAMLDVTGLTGPKYNIIATYGGNVNYYPCTASITHRNGTYSQLADEIGSGGDITLTYKYYVYDYGSTITINDTGVIDGMGAVIDMAGSDIRALFVNVSGVTLKNLTIKNAKYNGGAGGAIYFNGSATVENCNFTNNQAEYEEGDGGAIYFYGSGTVENCNFNNNKGKGNSADGSAIYFNVEGTVTNCNFNNNRLTGRNSRGVIFFNAKGDVTNCNFTNNLGAGWNTAGGAVYFYRNGTVTDCNFVNNEATDRGGAVFFNRAGNVTNCNFTNNKLDAEADYNKGGAIYFENTGIVENCNFINNQVMLGNAGAIYFNNQGIVSNCSFANNTGKLGGAIHFAENGEVTNCNFANNKARQRGGAIYSSYYWAASADTCIFKTDSDSTYQVHILPPTLNVDVSQFIISSENLTFDLKTNGGKPVYNGNISISIYSKNNNTWIANYSCLSNEEWTVDLPVGSYYVIFNTEYAKFEPLNITIKILPDVPFYANVTPTTTNNRTANITAKSNIPNDIIEGELQFVLDNGTEISANYNADGTWWAEYTFDDYGDYNINASYIGFSNVTINNATISISKANSTVNVTDVVLDYGDSINITVKTEGATEITAMINDVPITVINNYTIPISGLAAGNYTLTVTTIPDGDHESVTKTVTITVNKVNSTLAANNIIFNYGSSGSASVSCTGAAGINASVENHPEAIVNVTDNIITVSNLNAGNYTLKVTTIPDENHTEVTKTANITVNKIDATLTINEDIVFDYGSSNSTTVDFTGADYVEATVVGHDEAIVDVSGKTITVSGLGAGNYTLSVTAVADSNHNNVTRTADITVNKAVPAIEVSTNDVTYPENIIVTVKSNVAGYCTVTIGEESKDIALEADTAKEINFTELDANEEGYIINVTFGETANYTAAFNDTVSVKVFKADSSVTVYPVDNVTCGKDAVITYTVENKTTISVVVKDSKGSEITEGIDTSVEGTVRISGLDIGTYTITITNAAEGNYNASSAEAEFNVVDKSDVEFTKAKGHPGRVDQNATVEVILSQSDATGTVSINIDGVDYSAELVDGKAVIYAPLLPAGTYNANVVYSGDDNYKNNTAPVTFNVNKYYPTMKATAESVRADENATVNVALPSDATGTVTITVDGVDYTADVVDGTANVVLPVISESGTYSFDVIYSGDDKYRPYTKNVDVNVIKCNAKIKATARTVKLGNNVTVNVVLPSDATGETSIDINGTVYTGTVKDGAASIIIPDLGVGQYALTVDYSGDDKYKPTTTTVTFNVNKQTTSLKATARTVKVGDNVTVNIALASDATGEVIINVDGTDYTATAENGTATIVIPDLPYGQYALNVQYRGDNKYKARNTTVTFNVNKQSTTMKATARTVKVGDNVTVNVKLAEDTTGDVVITVDGVDYTATVVDGVASIVLPDLPADQYTLAVKYSGDDKYKNQSTTVKFNVNKYNVRMKVTAKYDSDDDYAIVSAKLSDDATGSISTEVNGNNYTVNLVDGEALILIPGLPAGEYTLDVAYSGDAKYKEYTATTTFKV